MRVSMLRHTGRCYQVALNVRTDVATLSSPAR